MNDFQKPIYRRQDVPIEQPQAIPPIDKDKKGQEEPSFDEQMSDSKTRTFLFASLFAHLRKLIDTFSFKGGVSRIVDPFTMIHDLQAFRDLLLFLGHDDQSHDPTYLQKLSGVWHKILEDFNLIDLPERKSLPIVNKIRGFINEILQYPQTDEHTLGYYLTEHVGNEWTPFPFMDLLQEIYNEHQANPDSSHLSHWVFLINDILAEFQLKPEPEA